MFHKDSIEIWIGYTDCLPQYLVETRVHRQNLNQFINMERSSWNFRTVKQLVTQNVSINFCPYKPEIQNPESMINLARSADSYLGLQKNDLLTVYCMYRGFWSTAPQTEDRDARRRGNWEGLHANTTNQASVQLRPLGLEVVNGLVFHPSGLWFTFQD